MMILSREIFRKGEASGKPFYPVKTYPSRMGRPLADYYSQQKNVVRYERALRLARIAQCNFILEYRFSSV